MGLLDAVDVDNKSCPEGADRNFPFSPGFTESPPLPTVKRVSVKVFEVDNPPLSVEAESAAGRKTAMKWPFDNIRIAHAGICYIDALYRCPPRI